MSDPELPWKHVVSGGNVMFVYNHPLGEEAVFNLGPKDQVMEAFSQFLCEQDFGE